MNRVTYLIFTLALAATACTSNSNPVTPAATTVTTFTIDFTGTLTQNGAFSFPFVVQSSGTLTAAIVSLVPNHLVGFGLGVWDGVACQTVPGIWNDRAGIASIVTATATAAGSLCVRIYDSQGGIIDPVDFDVQVVHP